MIILFVDAGAAVTNNVNVLPKRRSDSLGGIFLRLAPPFDLALQSKNTTRQSFCHLDPFSRRN